MLHGLLIMLLLGLVFMAVLAMMVVYAVKRGIERLRDSARRAMGLDPDDAGGGSTRGGDYTGRSSSQYSSRAGSGGGYSSSSGRYGGFSSGRYGSSSRGGGGGSSSSSWGGWSFRGGKRSDYGKPTIIDNRTPEEARRKIFSSDEGEYVDFEEEK